MRYLLYETKGAVEPALPTPESMAAIGKLMEDMTKAGVLLATGGLGAASTRLRSTGGKVVVTDGPFTETKELTGGFALIEAKSKDEALEWAKRFRQIVGEGESIIQEVF